MFGKQRETKTYVHRTGTVIVPMIRQAVGNDGMEDPDAFYASAQWPIGSSSRITNSKEEGSKKSKQLGIKEYSKTSPFENNDNDDETIASSTTNNNNRYNHVISKVRKHLEQLTKENMNSISMDLSSVSTETPSIQPSHNNHTGTNHESDVEYDHPFGDDEDDESNDNDGQLHIDEKKDEYTYNNDDDKIESFLESPNDLPRMDIRISQGTDQLKKLSSTSGSTSSDDDRTVVEHCSPDVEDIEENHHETHYSNRSAITPRSSRGGGNPASMNEKTSYDAHNRNNNNGYSATNKFDTSDDDHDDGDDGVGFEIRSSGGKNSAKQSKKRKSIVATQMRDNDSDSLTSDEEENVTPKSKFKRRTSPKTRKITSSTKRRKRINDGPSPSIATSTKKSTKKQKKKKASKYATVFESHGIPLPRTYTVTPVADLRMELSSSSNDNNNLRRSRRVRIKPLEFWKGECVEYGPNDFGDEYDGVTNMSVPMLIRTAEPTPYKPRKIPAMKHSPAPKDKKVKQTKTDDTNSLIVERFDDSKLRKKYKYIDDDVADIWNDTKAESVDTSKY